MDCSSFSTSDKSNVCNDDGYGPYMFAVTETPRDDYYDDDDDDNFMDRFELMEQQVATLMEEMEHVMNWKRRVRANTVNMTTKKKGMNKLWHFPTNEEPLSGFLFKR